MVDANDALIAEVSNDVNILWKDESLVPRKQDAGGQSSVRFQRNREILLDQWFDKVSKKLFEIRPKRWILGIYNFQENKFKSKLHQYTKDTLLATESFGYLNENGVLELVNKCSKQLHDIEYLENKLLVDEVEKLLATQPELVDYGLKERDYSKARIILFSSNCPEQEIKNIERAQCIKKKLNGFHIIDALKIVILY